jgi:hypothetical protein
MNSMGGSEATLDLLPRLKWARLPDVQRFVLPLTARGLAASFVRGRKPDREFSAGTIPGFVRLRQPRRSPAPTGRVGRIAEWRPGTPAALPTPQGEGLVQVLEQADLDWIAKMPAWLARPLGLTFFLDGKPAGFSLSQIEPTVTGLEACIVHLQIAQQDISLTNWIVGETTERLASNGAEVIRCAASSPEKITALRKAGFFARPPLASYWWPKAGAEAPTRTDMGYLRADDSIPFATLRARGSAAARTKSKAFPYGRAVDAGA